MEVSEFIKDVIYSLADGITEAIAHQKEHDVIVNPQITVGTDADHLYMPTDSRGYTSMARQVQRLELNIAFRVIEGNDLNAKASVNLFKVVSIGVGGSDTDKNIHEQRLRIAIPICLPVTKIPTKQ